MFRVISGEDIMSHINEYDAIIISANIYCTLQNHGVLDGLPESDQLQLF